MSEHELPFGLACNHRNRLVDIKQCNTTAGGWTRYIYQCKDCGERSEVLFKFSADTSLTYVIPDERNIYYDST
jgi:hypothetical protein